MSSPPCYNCGQNAVDLSGESQLMRINRLISDNYTLIIIAIISSIVLIFIIRYFGMELYKTIRDYRKGSKKMKDTGGNNNIVNIDDEDYEDEESSKIYSPLPYYSEGKQSFLKNVDKNYKNYNKLKKSYTEADDDTIDESLLFKNYDDYKYANKNKDS